VCFLLAIGHKGFAICFDQRQISKHTSTPAQGVLLPRRLVMACVYEAMAEPIVTAATRLSNRRCPRPANVECHASMLPKWLNEAAEEK